MGPSALSTSLSTRCDHHVATVVGSSSSSSSIISGSCIIFFVEPRRTQLAQHRQKSSKPRKMSTITCDTALISVPSNQVVGKNCELMGAVTSISVCPGNKGFFVGTSLSNRCSYNVDLTIAIPLLILQVHVQPTVRIEICVPKSIVISLQGCLFTAAGAPDAAVVATGAF